MKFVNCLTEMSPFLKWVASTVRGAKIIVGICVIGFVISVGDIVYEQSTGVSETSWGRRIERVERSENPQAFEGIIYFEMFRSAGLLLIALFGATMIASVRNYDVFAPGMEFKSIE